MNTYFMVCMPLLIYIYMFPCFDIRDLAIHGEVDKLFLESSVTSEIFADLLSLIIL